MLVLNFPLLLTSLTPREAMRVFCFQKPELGTPIMAKVMTIITKHDIIVTMNLIKRKKSNGKT